MFDLSQAPNSVALSHGFSQAQFVTELEERHTLWDRPGKLKLLYWLTRGNLGTYLDAISFGEATGTTPSTAAVRSFRTKDGFGLNLEQKLADDFGVFARASVSEGTVEEDTFTDINQSISGGLSLTGSRWGRPDDTVGLAGADLSSRQALSLGRRSGRDHRRRPTPSRSWRRITASAFLASPMSRFTTSSSTIRLITVSVVPSRFSPCTAPQILTAPFSA